MNPFKNRKGLGRGLSSLIGDNEIKTEKNKISISSILPNKFQPRKNFDEEKLSELTNSIRERGIIQPLIVRKSKEQNKYEFSDEPVSSDIISSIAPAIFDSKDTHVRNNGKNAILYIWYGNEYVCS